nr:BamA/TamA family outer membrane protein [Salinibacter ruber]
MGDHTVGATVLANGTVKDIGGGVAYLNRSGRLQWGGSLSHTPVQSGAWSVRREPIQIGDQVFQSTRIDQILQRTYIDAISAQTAYPLNVNQRLEGSLGFTRLSYDYEIETTRLVGNQVIEFDRTSAPTPPGLNLADATAAFVGDYSFFGFTSPIQGRRYRLEVGSRFGDLFYQSVLADYREYAFARPVTFAFRGLHLGRYGPDAEDPRLTPQFLGNGTLIRGYSYFSFDPVECGNSVGACPTFDCLVGSRTAIASAEVRLPVLGSRELGLVSFPYLPTELVAFVDGGMAWSSDAPPVFAFDRASDERILVFSTGLSARVNVLGFAVVELMGVFPFQRPDKGWHFDVQISPGW